MRYSLFAIVVFSAATADAQDSPFKIYGDTSGAPIGCSALAGIKALSDWFNAFNAADSAKLDRATAPRFVFSIGRFQPSEPFFVTHNMGTLIRYVRDRAGRRERMRIQEVAFNRWRSRGLEFGPIYFLRFARDLGSRSLPGVGKGEFFCGEGIHVLNVGPRPSLDPGPPQ